VVPHRRDRGDRGDGSAGAAKRRSQPESGAWTSRVS